MESNLYGPTTTKQILEGKHVKRGVAAHLVTLQALFTLYQKAFLEEPDAQMVTQVEAFAKELGSACLSGSREMITEASARMDEAVKSLEVAGRIKKFDEDHKQILTFQVFRHYMRMVMEMMRFIRAVKTGDWQLHLSWLTLFTNYFFAHDRLNYAR